MAPLCVVFLGWDAHLTSRRLFLAGPIQGLFVYNLKRRRAGQYICTQLATQTFLSLENKQQSWWFVLLRNRLSCTGRSLTPRLEKVKHSGQGRLKTRKALLLVECHWNQKEIRLIASNQRPLAVTQNVFNSERWAFLNSANYICFGIWCFCCHIYCL